MTYITGVGVIINHTLTAGIALLVISIHYVVVYNLCALAFSILGRRPGGLSSLVFLLLAHFPRKALESQEE